MKLITLLLLILYSTQIICWQWESGEEVNVAINEQVIKLCEKVAQNSTFL